MHRFVMAVARFMAILGGIVLSTLILIVCLSIVGRTLNSFLHTGLAQSVLGPLAQGLIDAGIGAIRGDFELVEAGMAFAIFAFLPLTQVTSGHASVDVFTAWLPPRALRVLRAAIEVAFAVALVIIAWQLKEGLESRIRSGQTTLLLQFPIWWAYALSLAGAAVAALAGVYMAGVRLAEAATGRAIVADTGPDTGPDMGAEH